MNEFYVFDTSVLYHYLKGKAGFDDRDVDQDHEIQVAAIESVMRNALVYIPHAAIVEITGQFLHQFIAGLNRDTLANHNYERYKQWYRARQAAINPIFQLLLDDDMNVRHWARVPLLENVSLIYDGITEGLHHDLIGFYRRQGARRELYPREPKCLDGMDGQILHDAMSIARDNRGTRCTFVTSDIPLQFAIKDIRRRASQRGSQLPNNLHFKSLKWLQGDVVRANGW